MGRPHPNELHLCNVGIELLLKNLTCLLNITLDIVQHLQAFQILLVLEHNHLDLLAGVCLP